MTADLCAPRICFKRPGPSLAPQGCVPLSTARSRSAGRQRQRLVSTLCRRVADGDVKPKLGFAIAGHGADEIEAGSCQELEAAQHRDGRPVRLVYKVPAV